MVTPASSAGSPEPRAARAPSSQGLVAGRATRIARRLFRFAIAIGVLVLIGWSFDLTPLTTPLPWTTSIKVNGALCFVLIGSALHLQLDGERRLPTPPSLVLSGLVALIAGTSLLEDLLGWDAHIDQLLVQDRAPQFSRPGRMSPLSAGNFLLLSGCCWTMDVQKGRLTPRLFPALVLLISGTALLGYLYGVRSLYMLGTLTPLAVHSAIAFLALGAGALLAHPEHDLLRILVGEGPEAGPTRRLLLGLIAIPILLSWLALRGEQAGLYGSEHEVALIAAGNVCLLLSLASATARTFLRKRLARQALERELGQKEAQLQAETRMRALAASLEEAIVITDAGGEIVESNRAAAALFGYGDEHALSGSVRQLIAEGEIELDDVISQPPPETLTAQRSPSTLLELHAKRRDGSSFPCELSIGSFRSEALLFRVHVFRDITQRYGAQQAVQQSEEKYRALAMHAPVGILEADAQGECTFVNTKWTEITGLSPEEARKKGWLSVLHPEDAERVGRAWYEGGVRGLPFSIDHRYLTKGGEVAWVQSSSVPLRGGSGAITGYIETIVDVTERKRTLDALAKSEASFRSLVERAPFGVLVLKEGIVAYANRTYLKLLGYDDLDELVGRPTLDFIRPDARAFAIERGKAIEAGATLPPAIVPCLRKDGSEVLLEGTSTPITFDGAPARAAVARDVTEQARAEQVRLLAERSLRESLREKEVLLKEIHHRVKNNLQVIVSLINLQGAKLEDPHAREVFAETRTRVHAIALLHERLYRSKSLGRIEMRDYLHGLISDLSSTNLDQRAIELRVTADDLYVEMDAAVPIGLIMNELVTNCYKHAFPRDRKSGGVIEVKLSREDGQVLISVADDGVGYPEGFDPETSESLGLLLISSLSRQLEGEVAFEQRPVGARCVVRFPDPTRAQSEAPTLAQRSA